MKAAVLRAYNTPLEIEDVQLADPGPHEVRVHTSACGVCHSDLHCLEGALPVPPPMVLGHEPAGIVEAVGSEVTYVQPGDHVIGCLSAFCGACEYCLRGEPNLCGGEATNRAPDAAPRISKGDETIHQFAHLSAFAEEMLVHENALVKIKEEMPLEQAALIGCGVTTGLGAAINTANIRPGQTAVVIGCGGVGLAAIQGCHIAGAARVIAVDTVPWKLELAQKLGASDGINAKETDAVAAVLEATGGGVDFSFECIGTPGTCQQAAMMIRKGGTCVLVGVVPIGVGVEFQPLDLVLQGKTIVGSMMGSNRFRIDMPRYVDFYLDGRLKLDEMISTRLSLEEVNTAFEKMKAGEIARSVISFD
ncbi:MAG: Zn-dependent alcohol dehydrogenase [Deltaproteobacteria bacterium]|nr:Zn-dependent alcohol dehydrogenase [Deltaproteobacteria bacterium]MBW2395368.1 Zn-dependent alcohol dehydrogenase [Deltaproteobacteria bacterium]